ncbi:MAG: serine/threonine protein phosphatase [Methylocystis sp.]|nr:serine/threonine protein phosphatase [Methylocystis sp.]MBI3275154.1 serine/threonine protein phosphatase [Methylocystis sp.]
MPDGTRVYAIGDIHGRADLLARVFDEIDAHRIGCPIDRPIEVYLGDYIDRGPQSRRVVDMIMQRAANPDVVPLTGNHEELFLKAMADANALEGWLWNGGRETLLSYGVAPPLHESRADLENAVRLMNELVPQSHVEFLGRLREIYECGDYVFVHAGLRPGVPLAEQARRDLLWIRGEFLSYKGCFPLKVVHGHTPVREPEVFPNRINIDTGAFMTGRLTCLTLEGASLDFL